MRLVVEVPDKTLERFKAVVTAEKRTQADVIRAAIERYIKNAERDADKDGDRPGAGS